MGAKSRKDFVWMDFMKKIPSNVKTAFFSALIIGIITHMYMLTNKFPNPDDTRHMFGMGVTVAGGRFGLAFLEHKWFGLDVSIFAAYSMPWLNGLLAISFIGASAALVVQIFQIKRSAVCVLVSFIMTAYPTVTGTLHYMFTAPAYFLSLFCSVLAVYLMYCCKKRGICAGGGILCLAAALSIYQAYFWFAIGLFIMIFIVNCIDGKYDKQYIQLLADLRLCLCFAAALLLYVLVNKICLAVSGIQMAAYGGLDSAFTLFGIDWLYYIKLCYQKFFENAYNPLEEGASFRFVLCAAMFLAWAVEFAYIIKYKVKKQSNLIKILLAALLILFPFGAGSIYLASRQFVHTLMIYPTVLLFILFLIFCERFFDIISPKSILRHLYKITTGCMLLVCLNYFVMANAIYLGSQVTADQAMAFLNRLAMRMEMVDQFDINTMPVAFIGSPNDLQYPHTLSGFYSLNNVVGVCFEHVPETDFEENVLLNSVANTNLQQMERYLGVKYQIAAAEEIKDIRETAQFHEMAVYPAADSLKIIDGVLVVKFIDS